MAPAIFPLRVDAGNLQIEDRLRLVRRHVPHQVEELPIRVLGQEPQQPVGPPAEGAGQIVDPVTGLQQLFGVDPDAVHGGADGQRLSVPVGDHAAMRRDGSHAQMTRVALTGEEFLIQQWKVATTVR